MQRREWFDIICRDLSFALRQARREAVVTAVIVATLSLGVGANIVMFDVVDRLLLSPPSHVPHADRVVRPWFARTADRWGPTATFVTNWPMYEQLAAARSFSGVGAFTFAARSSIGTGRDASPATVEGATASLFSVLGARPARGRFYTRGEDVPPSGSAIAVVSHSYYERHPDVLGRTLRVQDVAYTVVGVAAKGFTGPTLDPVDVWIPLTRWLFEEDRGDRYLHDDRSYRLSTAARLRDGVTIERATAEASTVFAAAVGSSNALRTAAPHVVLASIIPGRGPDPHSTPTVAAWLLGVAGIVLVIACANVATLLLIRAIRRRGEIAVRLSLGVARTRLMAQFVAEGALLVAAATVAALVIARVAHRMIYSMLLPGTAPDAGIPTSHIALLVAAIAMITIVVTALAPVLHTRRIDIAGSLRGSSVSTTPSSSRGRTTLAVAQVALSVILLIGAALFVRSLSNLRAVPLGLDADRLIVASVDFPQSDDHTDFWRDALRRVSTVPDVANAALAIGIPFRFSLGIRFSVAGRDSLPHVSSGGPYANGVSATYFATLGTRLLRGRGFTEADRRGAPRVAIVNTTLARLVWPNQSPLGACVHVGQDQSSCVTVVGVVEDVHRNGVLEPAQMQYYVPLAQWPTPFGEPAMLLRARSASAVPRTAGDVRRALQGASSNVSYPLVDSFASVIDPQLESWMLGARMFTVFGGLAFVIALIGLYGLLAHNVAQRRREMGIRAALGARGDDIVGLVVAHGLRIVIVGLAIGLGAAAVLAGRVETLLFGVEPRDVATYVAITLLAGSLAIAASIIPARRAAAIDPSEALRAE